MAKKLTPFQTDSFLQLLMEPGIPYYIDGGFPFCIFYELIDKGEKYEETDKIIGFEIYDIATINEDEIPEIDEKFDLIGTDLKDMTIKQIVMIVQEQVGKQEEQSHPGRKIA